jgi:hypothetical protein
VNSLQVVDVFKDVVAPEDLDDSDEAVTKRVSALTRVVCFLHALYLIYTVLKHLVLDTGAL